MHTYGFRRRWSCGSLSTPGPNACMHTFLFGSGRQPVHWWRGAAGRRDLGRQKVRQCWIHQDTALLGSWRCHSFELELHIFVVLQCAFVELHEHMCSVTVCMAPLLSCIYLSLLQLRLRQPLLPVLRHAVRTVPTNEYICTERI